MTASRLDIVNILVRVPAISRLLYVLDVMPRYVMR